MLEVNPPRAVQYPGHKHNIVFLSGSIEMGKAKDWQREVIEKLKDEDLIILNPRRSDWDSSWKQSLEDERFVEQVNWELSGLEIADIIVVHLEPETMAPITLMEIGLYARLCPQKLIVHCPQGYWRKGNIDVLCKRYHIKQVQSLDEMIDIIKDKNKWYVEGSRI